MIKNNTQQYTYKKYNINNFLLPSEFISRCGSCFLPSWR